MEISLAGKVALVTGAGPNIGSGIALALARYGAKVACNDVDADAGKAAADRIERNAGTAIAALGNFLNTKHVGRHMAEHGIRGSIVAISSSNGWSGSAGVIAYAFHKGGVNNFVRAAAMDLAPYGIRVNSYTPTAPTPDNPELIAERGPGGVLERPRSGGIGGQAGDEPWRRPSRWTGQRAPM